MSLVLHGYWRSGAAYRVRIALNLNSLAATPANVDLRTGAQRGAGHRAIQPQGLVPAIEGEDGALIQSGAIIEWLEERWPEPPLLPAAPGDRAIVRAMAAVIGCDIHPLNNLRVLNALRDDLGMSEAQVSAWIARWVGEGFAALETMIARHGDGFAFGSSPPLADCYLVPQLYSAERFAVDTEPYPKLVAAAERARALPAFAAADPACQPDAAGQ